MFGSVVLEVAIGMVLVYLLLSALCTVLTEMLAQAFAMRSQMLDSGIRKLLGDPEGTGLAKKVYDHPMIDSLAPKNRGRALIGRGGKPSYVPSRSFALALVDAISTNEEAGPKTAGELRARVAQLPKGPLRQSLLTLIDASGGDLGEARKSIETWFDDAMDRVSGWYKRNSQFIVLALGLVISIALNADSITLANRLWVDPAIRDVVVTAAQETVKKPDVPGGDAAKAQAEQVQSQLRQLQLPMGWSPAPDGLHNLPTDLWGWLTKVVGLLVTTAAISFGAPFWFDALKNLVNLRAAGKPPARTSESAAA